MTIKLLNCNNGDCRMTDCHSCELGEHDSNKQINSYRCKAFLWWMKKNHIKKLDDMNENKRIIIIQKYLKHLHIMKVIDRILK